MSYYRIHLFFCTNQRENGKQCCNDAGGSTMRDYAKRRLQELGLTGSGGVRVSAAGCLGRCSEGPSLVIYPQGVWYTYNNSDDIERILFEHVQNGRIVTDLLMEKRV
jgi:(2Fe-2S) ferredoxin